MFSGWKPVGVLLGADAARGPPPRRGAPAAGTARGSRAPSGPRCTPSMIPFSSTCVRSAGRRMSTRSDPDLGAVLLLHSYVGVRRGVVADEHDGEPGVVPVAITRSTSRAARPRTSAATSLPSMICAMCPIAFSKCAYAPDGARARLVYHASRGRRTACAPRLTSRRRLPSSLLDDAKQAPELVGPRRADELVHDRLRHGDDGAGGPHPVERRAVSVGVARAAGVGETCTSSPSGGRAVRSARCRCASPCRRARAANDHCAETICGEPGISEAVERDLVGVSAPSALRPRPPRCASATVGSVSPSPSGYCRVTTIGTPTSAAVLTSRTTEATTASRRSIAAARRCWMSTTTSSASSRRRDRRRGRASAAPRVGGRLRRCSARTCDSRPTAWGYKPCGRRTADASPRTTRR